MNNETVTVLLGEYDHDEIEHLLEVTKHFKTRFAVIANQMIEAGTKADLDEHLIRSSIVAECLLLAACLFSGTSDGFVEVARAAHRDIGRVVPPVTLAS